MQAAGLEPPAAGWVVPRLEAQDHRFQCLGVVGVGGRYADDQGQSVRVRQDVHLGTRLAPVHGARAGEVAPLFARMCAESRTTRERSTRPASSS
ncbi:hypothetical protein A6A06_01695 [Streptomyces sp. CB02923]|nr:hypothetical protein A6A06_01695 [Streptomyces sp. CB02923]